MTRLATLAAVAALLTPLAWASDVTVQDGWVRAAPPGARVMAGYFRLTNPGDEARTLVGASSPRFDAVEIHTTRMVDGKALMRREDKVTVDPGATVDFEPGGRHLMLMQPESTPAPGDTVEVELSFEDGSSLTVTLPVKRDDGGAADHAHHHH